MRGHGSHHTKITGNNHALSVEINAVQEDRSNENVRNGLKRNQIFSVSYGQIDSITSKIEFKRLTKSWKICWLNFLNKTRAILLIKEVTARHIQNRGSNYNAYRPLISGFPNTNTDSAAP